MVVCVGRGRWTGNVEQEATMVPGGLDVLLTETDSQEAPNYICPCEVLWDVQGNMSRK